MRELIKINQDGTVSARELHQFLEVRRDFSSWCKQMFDYGFLEGQDFSPNLVKTQNGGRPAIDYLLTLDCAKEIAMLQRSEKGQQARRYFIECEKQLRELAAPRIPQNLREALLLAAELEGERERLAVEVKALRPKADYTDKVLSSVTEWTTTTIAKELGMSAIRLNSELYRLNVQYQNSDGVWVLYAKYDGKGYTETRTHAHTNSRNEVITKMYTVWTEKGRYFIHEMVGRNEMIEI